VERKLKPTKFRGVLFREHPTRRHGVQKDRYFVIYYRWQGKNYQEGLGWSSQSQGQDKRGWTAKKAAALLGELKENQRRGEGPKTLKEKRELDERLRMEQEAAGLTFGEFFRDTYLPAQESKALQSVRREESLFNAWLEPRLGAKTFADISELALEKLRKDMQNAGRSARTIEYGFALIRQVWKLAERKGKTGKAWPGKNIRRPKVDNRRTAFFSPEQADQLLATLAVRSPQWRDITLLSLHTGMRAGEIFGLTWSDLDLPNGGLIHVRDTKSGRDRFCYMTSSVRAMFQSMNSGEPEEPVFKSRSGGPIREVSGTVQQSIDSLGFNQGIRDRRHKLTFHSARHSFASWCAMGGVDLFLLQKLLGHETPAMTSRYSHLNKEGFRKAVGVIEAVHVIEAVADSKAKVKVLSKKEVPGGS